MKVKVIKFLALLICCCSIAGCTQNSKPEQYEGIEILEFDGEIRFSTLAWSPDGQMLAAKYQIDPLGGASAAIIDITSGTFQTILPEQADYFIAPEWSPDSKSLIVTTYVERQTEDTPFNIFVIDTQNGQTKRGVWYGSIATWSNEPDKVIVIDSDVGHLGEQVPILEIDLESGEYRQFAQAEAAEAQINDSFDVSANGYLAVMNQGGLEIYDVEVNETFQKRRIVHHGCCIQLNQKEFNHEHDPHKFNRKTV